MEKERVGSSGGSEMGKEGGRKRETWKEGMW